MNNTLRKERVTVYDHLRFLAMIFVVIGHSTYLVMTTNCGGVSYELPANVSSLYNSGLFVFWRDFSLWVYEFHMPLFFMLSGAVLALRPLGSFDSILRSKVKRLLIPYYVYGLLFMLPVKRLAGFYNNSQFREATISFFSGGNCGHLWFLIALFWCIMVFTALAKLLEKAGIKSVYFLLLICGVIQLTYSHLPFDLLSLKQGLSYIFYFALGFVFEHERQKNPKWNIKKTLFAVLIMAGIETVNNRFAFLDQFFKILIGSFLTCLLADLLDRAFSKSKSKIYNRCRDFVIPNLFYVYLFHDPLEYVVLKLFFSKGLLSSGAGCIAYLLCRTLVIFVISLFMGKLVGIGKQIAQKVLGSKNDGKKALQKDNMIGAAETK